jgi:hypothetical protein
MEVSGHFDDAAVLSPRNEAKIPIWIGGLVGSRADLDSVRKEMKSVPAENRIPVVQTIDSLSTD